MIEHSKYSIVVADSSKFGVVAMNAVSTLKEIGILVTDSQIPKEIRQGLRKTAVPTITVDV
jgi:DeoR/GlpR family transcriptional regulator of sugar metabolism